MTRSQIVVPALGALLGLVVAITLYVRYGPDEGVAAQLRGYRVLSDRAVRVDVEVAREPGTAAYCVVRARNSAGAEVGRAAVDVPPSPNRTSLLRYELATSDRSVGGELVGCAPGTAPPPP